MSKGIRLYFKSREDQESNGGLNQTGLHLDDQGQRCCDAIKGKDKKQCTSVLNEVG